MAKSDAAIIEASLQTPEDFGALFDRHATAVLKFFVRRIGNDEAGGLVGEVFRIAFERRDAFDTDHTSALPWLYGIAANQLLNHRRSQSRRLRTLAEFSTHAETSTTTGAVEVHLLWPKLIVALEALSDDERTPLLMSTLEEMKYEDIATALAIPVGTVRSRINRARKRLRSALDGDAHESE